MQKTLSLETLGELDSGAAGVVIDAAIRTAVADIDDRGEDGKPRKVVIELTLSKMDNGLLAAHVEADARLPKRRTNSTLGKVSVSRGQPSMVFSAYGGDPEQSTIDDYTEAKNAD